MQDNNNEFFKNSVNSNDTISIDNHSDNSIDDVTQQVSILREAIIALEEKIINETNSDEIFHLKYDLDELKKEFKKLKDSIEDNQ